MREALNLVWGNRMGASLNASILMLAEWGISKRSCAASTRGFSGLDWLKP